jgi:hypothetical protein
VQAASDTQPQPLESPFLPNAVVEKRPLGGEAPALSAQNDELSFDDFHDTTPAAISQAEDAAVNTVEASGATDSVATPVNHFAQPAKKKSSIGVVIWIIALILIGAGAGVGFYFYVLPLL